MRVDVVRFDLHFFGNGDLQLVTLQKTVFVHVVLAHLGPELQVLEFLLGEATRSSIKKFPYFSGRFACHAEPVRHIDHIGELGLAIGIGGLLTEHGYADDGGFRFLVRLCGDGDGGGGKVGLRRLALVFGGDNGDFQPIASVAFVFLVIDDFDDKRMPNEGR